MTLNTEWLVLDLETRELIMVVATEAEASNYTESRWGAGGGEMERQVGTNLYRCPDFDNEWKPFDTVTAADTYYNELAA